MASIGWADSFMRILTNMAFWQSPTWTGSTVSIFRLADHTETQPPSVARQAWLLWKQAPAFDVVVTMGSRESLVYGLLCDLTGRPAKQVMTEVFIDMARQGSPFWRLKQSLFRRVSRRAIGILTNSTHEIEAMAGRFGVPVVKVRYVPMHTNILQPDMHPAVDRVVLSAGYTLRDYPSLLRAAPLIRAPVTILCSGRDAMPAPLPDNVTVLREIPYKDYLEQLKRCTVAVIPLQRVERSTGQVALLEAMAFGKPVVTTRSPGTTDYIRNGVNGILLEPGDVDGIAREVNRLLDQPEQARLLAQQALDDIRNHFTIEGHARAKLRAIEELWHQHRSQGFST